MTNSQTFLEKVLETFKNLLDSFGGITGVVTIIGVIIALLAYLYQRKQQKYQETKDRTSDILKTFRSNIDENDLKIWKEVFKNTYEGMGAKPNHFIVFSERNQMIQIPISYLFTSEGNGLIIPNSRFSTDDSISNLELGSIRKITEQLNIISYIILGKEVDIKSIYYELGQIIEVIYNWIDGITEEDIKHNYIYFINMYEKYQQKMKEIPYKIYVRGC